ncbi:hypothetical protein [Chryseobacterium balustinum]|uniref:hypothetical protein n=1 Tax=Chryseobacterium balustinum TaxID=246 RepID=UPI001E30A403|nr:hypothetical protein [Chryseobacterium balustinum]
MEIKTQKQILQTIGEVYEQAKNCQLEQSFLSTVKDELVILSQYFRTTEEQSFFIAVVFTLNYKGELADLNNLSEYFNCNPLRMLEFHQDLEFLCSNGFFLKEKSKRALKIAGAGERYTVEEKISEAILLQLPIPKIKKKEVKNIIDLLEQLHILGTKRDEDLISTMTLFRETEFHLEKNIHLPLIKKVKQLGFKTEENYLFLYLVWKTISGSSTSDIGTVLDGIYDQKQKRIQEMQKMMNDEHTLIKHNFIEIVPADFFNDTEMKLTDVSLQFLNDCDIKLFIKKRKETMSLSRQILFRENSFLT